MTMEHTVKIGSKTFKFVKVNLRVRDLYLGMTDLVADLSLLGQEAEASTDQMNLELEATDKPLEKIKIRAKARALLVDVDKRRRALQKDIWAKREELLQAILIKNGYEYDRDFWWEEADIEDVNDIIVSLFKGGGGSNPPQASRTTKTGSGPS